MQRQRCYDETVPHPAGAFIVLKSTLALLDPGAGAFSIMIFTRASAILADFGRRQEQQLTCLSYPRSGACAVQADAAVSAAVHHLKRHHCHVMHHPFS